MSFLVDLPVEVETRLQAEAARQGVAPTDVACRLIVSGLPDAVPTEAERFAQWADTEKADAPEAERKRIEAIGALIGKYAHLGPMVEELHRERQADKVREEQRIAGYTP